MAVWDMSRTWRGWGSNHTKLRDSPVVRGINSANFTFFPVEMNVATKLIGADDDDDDGETDSA